MDGLVSVRIGGFQQECVVFSRDWWVSLRMGGCQ